MGKDKCITLTTWWWLTTIGCSYTWTSSKWGHTMTSIFYASVTSTKIDYNDNGYKRLYSSHVKIDVLSHLDTMKQKIFQQT